MVLLSYLNPRQAKSLPNLISLLGGRSSLVDTKKNDDDTVSVSSTSISSSSEEQQEFDVSFLRQFVADEVVAICSNALPKSNITATTCPRREGLRALGSLLWQWKLQHGSLEEFFLPDFFQSLSRATIQKSIEAVDAIVVLKNDTHDATTREFLAAYNSRLVGPLRKSLLERLQHHQPEEFAALVGDFNDNMAYHMEQGRGLTLPDNSHDKEDKFSQDDDDDVAYLEVTFQETLQSPHEVEYQGSFLQTQEQTIPQPAHVDFSWQVLDESSRDLRLAFCPLTQHGMMLQVWPRQNKNYTSGTASTARGVLVFVPYGRMLVMPSDTIHGGGFRMQGGHGNLRYHWYLAVQPTALPRFAKNIYTERQDPSQWLDVTCTPALGLPPSCTTTATSSATNNHAGKDDEGLLMDLLFE